MPTIKPLIIWKGRAGFIGPGQDIVAFVLEPKTNATVAAFMELDCRLPGSIADGRIDQDYFGSKATLKRRAEWVLRLWLARAGLEAKKEIR